MSRELFLWVAILFSVHWPIPQLSETSCQAQQHGMNVSGKKEQLTYLFPFFQQCQSCVDYCLSAKSWFSCKWSCFDVVRGKLSSSNFNIISNINCYIDPYKIKIACTWLVCLSPRAWTLWFLICRQWLCMFAIRPPRLRCLMFGPVWFFKLNMLFNVLERSSLFQHLQILVEAIYICDHSAYFKNRSWFYLFYGNLFSNRNIFNSNEKESVVLSAKKNMWTFEDCLLTGLSMFY